MRGLLLSALAVVGFVAAVLPADAGTLVIENVSVVDVASGVVRPPARVVIQGPADQGIDGHGKFLIPGLWDMHAHTTTEADLRKLVGQGVVGVRDFDSPWQRVTAWREAMDRGRFVGPAVLGAGEAVNARGPAEARKTFDRLWDLDVDFIGIERGIAPEAYIALAEQARHWRLSLAGPLPAGIGGWGAAELRHSTIEGTTGLETLAADVWDRWALMGTRLTPLLAAEADPQRPAAYGIVKKARQAGVQILAGSGAGVNIQQELEQLVGAGLTPREALEAATLAPRRVLPVQRNDVVLLEANPLEDIRNARRVAGVVLRGRYYPAAELK